MNIKHAFYLSLSLLAFFASSSTLGKDMPGATQTSYGVGSTGAFEFSMPIVVPQGRNGVQPNLGLNFSSSRGAGALGVGWSVSGLSAITRCGKSLAVDGVRTGVQHNANDRYCLNGQRLILVSGTQGAAGSQYRTFIDGFSKIEAVGNGSVNVNGGTAPTSWRVWTKGGQIIDYGAPKGLASHSAQFKLPGTNSIHTWNMVRMHDREGNFYEATYRTADGLIDKIEYGNANKQKVDFIYAPNTVDSRSRYVHGSKINVNHRLQQVEVHNNGNVFRRYQLRYEAAPISGRSRVLGVTECGTSAQANACLPEVTFDWQTAQAGYENGSNSSTQHNIAPDDLIEYYNYQRQKGDYTAENAVKEINRGTWADVNGDGEADLVIAYTTPSGSTVKKTYLRQNNTWLESGTWALPRPLRSYDNAVVNTQKARFLPGVIKMGQLADVNGDGLLDVVYSYRLDNAPSQNGVLGDPYSDVEEVRETYLNTGSGWGQPVVAWAPKDFIFDYLTNSGTRQVYYQGQPLNDYEIIRTETTRASLVDLNGDGLLDWVTAYFQHTNDGNGIEHRHTYLNTGTAWASSASTAYKMPDVFSQYRNIYNISRGQFVDVNGDGLIDWMSSYQTATDPFQQGVWLNTGIGWSEQAANSPYILPEIMFDNSNGWNNISPVTRGRFIDVNGDGLSDWVASYQRPASGGAQEKFVRLNTGKGWLARNSGFQAPTFLHVNFAYSSFERGWPVNKGGDYMDVNQDGLVDYVESYKSSATNFPISKKAYLNTGTGWVAQATSSPYTPTLLRYDYSGRENAKPNYGQFVDVNADGGRDWVTTRNGTTRTTRLMKNARYDQLDKVTTTMGVTIKPNFLPLTNNTALYTQYPSNGGTAVAAEPDGRFVRGPMQVTASVVTPTPDPAVYRATSYQYEGLQVSRTYGALGFNNVTTVDSLTGISSYRQVYQTFPYTGRTKYSATSKDGKSISKSSSQYTHTANSNGTVFPRLLSSSSEQFEFNATTAGSETAGLYRKSAVGGLVFDAYGNLSNQTTTIRDGSDVLLHTTSVVNTFKPVNTAQWLVGQVASVTQTNTTVGKSGISNHSTFDYVDVTNSGVVSRRLDTVNREPNSSQPGVRLITKYDYDSVGNVTKESSYAPGDASDILKHRVDEVGYDSDQRLPVTLTNALGHVSTIGYHNTCDQPNSVTDENGLTSTVTYDELCRVTTQTSPVGLTSSVLYDDTCRASLYRRTFHQFIGHSVWLI